MNSRKSPYHSGPFAFVGIVVVAAVVAAGASPAAAVAGWTIYPSPTPSPGTDLNGVAVLGATNAWAVGKNHRYGSDHQMAILRWDGSAWSIAAAPNSRCYNEALFDITFTSTSNGWAVGESPISAHRPSICGTPPRRGPLVIRWNGTAWSVVETPVTPAGATPTLRAVSALSSTSAWAVGRASFGSPLVARFTSGAWRLVSVPTADLYDVAAVSSSDVWAVGSTFPDNAGTTSPRILHFNGTTWASVSTNAPSGARSLHGVAAVSATNLWAVGFAATATGHRPLILHFINGSWQNVATPALPSGVSGFLEGVTAIAANDIWAVGRDSSNRTLTMHYNGTSWSIVPSPNQDLADPNQLNAVAAHGPSSQIWAVGEWRGTVPATLTMRYQPN